MTSNWLKNHYNRINKKYFKSELPNVWVHYGKIRDREILGYTRFKRLCKSCDVCIKLRIKYSGEVKTDRLPIEVVIDSSLSKGKGGRDVSLLTLIHEMIHISTGGKYLHGPKFRKERKRLLRAGVYNRLL